MESVLNGILTLNLVATTVVFYVAARIYLLPYLSQLRPRAVLIPILLLHSFRQLGLMFLTRGATYPGLPPQFAYPAALGDLLTAALALFALYLVSRNSTNARSLVWVFNIFGTIDLLVCDHSRDGLRRAFIYGAGLLDSCVLGSCSPGHSLCNISNPDQALGRSSMSSHAGTESHERRSTSESHWRARGRRGRARCFGHRPIGHRSRLNPTIGN